MNRMYKVYSFYSIVILRIKTKRCQNSEENNPNLLSAVSLNK